MSSSSWVYNARRFNFPLPQKLQALIAQFNAKITDDVSDEGGEELQTRSEGGIGRSYLKFCDNELTRLDNSLTSTILTTIESCPTFEPDYQYCKLIVEFDNVGGVIPDYSGYEHYASVFGIPRMRYGIRYGYGPLSLEAIFDGRTNYGSIRDTRDLDFDNVDFTLMFRFSPFDLSLSSVNSQVLVCKKDDGFATNGQWYACELYTDGSLTFNLVLSSTDRYSITTPPGTIEETSFLHTSPTSQRFDVVITFAFLTRTLIIYVNGTSYTSMSTSIPVGSIVPSYTGADLQIGRHAPLVGKPVTLPELPDNTDPIRLFSKLYFGTFQQLKYWKGKALTSTEVSNHYTNKVTISNVPAGEIAIPNGGMILIT
jgi:hypothetical protein